MNKIGAQAYLHSPDMSNIDSIQNSDDDFASDFDSAAEEDLPGEDSGNLPGPLPGPSPPQYTLNMPDTAFMSSFAENRPWGSTSSPEMCVVSS